MSLYPVDISLLATKAHNATLKDLEASMGGRGVGRLQDYCVPVNSYFPTPEIFAELHASLAEQLKFYPPHSDLIAERLARVLGLAPETVALGNGSTELITWADHLFVRESLLTDVPTFGRWTDQPRETGKRVEYYERESALGFDVDIGAFIDRVRRTDARVVALSNPNNPTGALLKVDAVRELCDAFSDRDLFIIDESFIEFSEIDAVPTFEGHASAYPNVLVLKSLGKNFGLHGVRLGYAVANPTLIRTLRLALPRWNVNALGEMLVLLFEKHRDIYEASRRRVIADRDHLAGLLARQPGLRAYPSKANFVYIELAARFDGVDVRNRLLTEHGIFLRECGNKLGASSQFFRVAARPAAANTALVAALAQVLGQPALGSTLHATCASDECFQAGSQ